MIQIRMKYILLFIASIFTTGTFGQVEDTDYEILPVEDNAPIMKLPADADRNSVVVFTATTGDGTCGTLNTVYYDGLGRIKEEVGVGITPQKNDIVTWHEYSSLERKEWLGVPFPIASQGAGCKTKDKYIEAATTALNDNNPYTKYSYENSPLGRLETVTGPGVAWHNAHKAVRHAYMANQGNNDTLKCLRHEIKESAAGISVSISGLYTDGSLTVTRTENEDRQTVLTFHDRDERIILLRTIDRTSGNDLYDTYYVYDIKGNLRAVLPPELTLNSNSGMIEQDMLEKYAYIYGYDTRDRMCLRKTPGADPELFIYDAADRMVYRQDGEMRKKGKCVFTAYDAFGRECVTGICSYGFPADVKSFFLTAICRCEYTGADNAFMGYDITGISVPSPTVLTAKFYDRYTFIAGNVDLEYNNENGYGQKFGRALGLSTGKVIARLSGAGSTVYYDSTAIYYDDRGRTIQTKATNHLEGYDIHYYAYDFAGNETGHKHVHAFRLGCNVDLEEVYNTTYDHAGRPLVTTHAINGNTPVTIANRKYDEQGRLTTDIKNGQTSLRTAYEYNIRSWPVKIGTTMKYVKLIYTGVGAGITSRYGGDIAAVQWTVNGVDRCQYNFFYDGLSRLIRARYYEKNSYTRKYDTEYAYDRNGNITTLNRRGFITGTGTRDIDKLSLVYDGNQLVKVDDQINGPYNKGLMHFNDRAKESIEYEYDANGNLTTDLNKGITAISYNVTNRPAKIDFDNGKSISYMYGAEGEKQRVIYVLDFIHIISPTTSVMQGEDGDVTKRTPYGTAQKIQIGAGNIDSLITRPGTPIAVPYGMRIFDYCENIIYDNYEFDRLLFDGGYVTFFGDAPIYHFYLKDHLGNVRVVFNQDGTVEQVNQYYPFGALFYNTVNDEFQRYKFNGKELDRLLGIDWYDYGARMYDPILCRWNTPDPLADDYQNISPYAYCLDNPVKFVDPDGRSVWTKMLKGGYRMAKAVSKKGFSALTQADTYYDIVSDITENANTLLSDEASSEEKFIAGASLASEFLPVSIGDVKDGVKIVKAVHGNSKASTRAQHAYDIIDKSTGKIVKTGVSSGKIRKDGKSYRAESQVRKWNRQEGEDRYESIITHKEPAGKNAREKIYDYEKDRANTLREQGHLKDEYKHKRP